MRFRLRLIIGIWLVSVFIFNASAQNFKVNTKPKGIKLPVQTIVEIEQDTLGRMWFSTPRGVYYSDGIQTFSLPDSLFSQFDFQISILKDPDGSIWLYNDRGLPKMFKGGYGTWEEVELNHKIDPRYSTGIKLFVLGKGAEKRYFMDTRYQFFTWKESESPSEVKRDIESIGFLNSVTQLKNAVLLNFKNETKLWKDGKFEDVFFEGIKLPSIPVLIKQSPETGDYYFLGKNYLARGKDALRPSEIVATNFEKEFFFANDEYGLDFFEGNVFYHFNSSLQKLPYTSNFPLEIDLDYVFNSFSIMSFLIDREGILWIGTVRGLANLNSLKFQNYGVWQSEFLLEEVTAIHKLPDGTFLFGYNNGVQKSSRNSIKTIYNDQSPGGIPTHRIVNFSAGKTNDVWFSANYGGVGRFDVGTEKVELYKAKDEINISSVVVQDSIYITSPKTLFVAPVTARGNQLYQNNLGKELEELLGSSFYYLRKAAKLSDGRIIVIQASKLENQRPVLENERMIIVEGYDFLETENGILLGTESGFKIIKDGKLSSYLINDREINRPVYAILKDSKARIWLGTDDGVFVIEKNHLTHYNEASGLVGNEVNRGALIEGNNGRIMIGTMKGFSIFLEDEGFEAFGVPNAYIRSVNVGGESLTKNPGMKAPYTQNFLEVDYSAIGFNEEEELWVHYRLKGFSNDWEIVKDPHSTRIFYGSLPPGSYQFELKASYGGEIFSPTVTSSGFVIAKPFYLQYWFLVLMVILLIGIGILINIFYRQLRKVDVLESAFDKKNEEKLMAEHQFKNVWDSSKDGLALSFDGEELIAANPALAKLLEIKTEDLVGRNVTTLIADKEFEETFFPVYKEKISQIDEEGFSIVATVPWPTGTIEVEIFNRLIKTNSNGRRIILSVIRDISAEKAIENKLRDAKEKAEQANRFKTSLLSNISHEIRTPLNGILGGTEHVMMTRQGDTKLISQLDIILQSGERLLKTINSILDMAKIEANKMEVVYSDTDIHAFFKEIISPLRSMAERKGLKLREEYPVQPIRGNIDRRFMEMIINNLVSNAIKYSEKGEIKLSLRQQNSDLIIVLEDQGVGMSEEFLRKVFSPFEQESTGNKRLYEGTGLGMTITKNLVDMLNGEIKIETEKNKGTLVVVKIPLPEL